MFGLMLNGIINFWPFDLNENFDLTSLKLDYQQTVRCDRKDSEEAIVVRGSCSAPYQDF